MDEPIKLTPGATCDAPPDYTVTVIDPGYGPRVSVALWDDDNILVLSPDAARRFAGRLMRAADDAEEPGGNGG